MGTVFVLQNRSKRQEADDLCSSAAGCPASRRAEVEGLDKDANTAATMAWVGYAVGAAGLGASAVLFFLSRRASNDSRTAVRVQPWIGLRSVGLGGAF
jgi:hypothetical protein